MIHKIINILLILFKVKYIKQSPLQHFNRKWGFKAYYDVYINVGTILNPVWYGHPYRKITNIKDIYLQYQVTKDVYKYVKDIHNRGKQKFDFHEYLKELHNRAIKEQQSHPYYK